MKKSFFTFSLQNKKLFSLDLNGSDSMYFSPIERRGINGWVGSINSVSPVRCITEHWKLLRLFFIKKTYRFYVCILNRLYLVASFLFFCFQPNVFIFILIQSEHIFLNSFPFVMTVLKKKLYDNVGCFVKKTYSYLILTNLP